MELQIAPDVAQVLDTLRAAGQEAWCVGGCVRDLALGRQPEDWDVTTSARPEETMALFAGRALPTGLRHGTVTVCTPLRRVEVTTFRLDGAYADHRRPERVTFSASLEEDLRRRDFTVNAMALGADGTLRDPWGGLADLRDGVLRCVGEADRRFDEDALRILRCLRFSAVLGFSVEGQTAAAVHRRRELLRAIAAERIMSELGKLLCGKNAAAVLREYTDVIAVFLPEILPAVGFDQRNPHHCWDVWEHTIRAVAAAPAERSVRLALLFHDLGKPGCFCLDGQGVGHFPGHPAASRAIAARALERLRLGNDERELVLSLVENHDRRFSPTERGVRRALQALGQRRLRLLLEVCRADNLAQAPDFRGTQAELDRFAAALDAALAAGACFSLRQLAVNGRDLTALGFAGPAVGHTLARLLHAVVEGQLPNERGALLAAAVRPEDAD